eukprot:sb/3474936/
MIDSMFWTHLMNSVGWLRKGLGSSWYACNNNNNNNNNNNKDTYLYAALTSQGQDSIANLDTERRSERLLREESVFMTGDIIIRSEDNVEDLYCKQPIKTRYLCHVTGCQPIRDQHYLIRSFPGGREAHGYS